MKAEAENRFTLELEEVRRKLAEQGRDVGRIAEEANSAGLTFDFELPYSSLATIPTEKWH